MNKMKRVFSLVLVLSMILGSFGAALPVVHAAEGANAATEELKKVPKDVKGTEYEKAVSRLVAFGVLEGYEDGTYKPEKDVTRAEFAKILVESLGISRAASAAKGQSQFKDVTASHWASGYINVASGNGLIKGFPDGTYKPEDKVSHAEALTMLVRALGYQDSFLKGMWPGSHIAKAAEVGITSGVKFNDAGGFANRGNVAQMVNNTLDSDVVKVDKYKDGTTEYTESEKTLLKDKLDISKYEDTRVIADKIVDDGLQKDEIKVLFLKDIDKDDESVKKSYGKNDDKIFTVTKNVVARTLIGEEVSVYMNDRDEVVYIESENDDRANFDYIEEAVGDKDYTEEISLVKFDKDYKFDEDAVVYVYNASDDEFKIKTIDSKDGAKEAEENFLGCVGKFVVKNNKIVYAEVMDSSEASPWMLVKENDKGILKGINEVTEDFDLDLRSDGNYDGVLAYDASGNAIDVKDIEEGNIVYAAQLDYDGDDYAYVVAVQDNQVEGKLSRVKDDRVTIDGKEIKATAYSVKGDKDKHFQAFYSVEGFEDIKAWNNGDFDTDMEDADDEEMVAYLDAAGRIAFLSTKALGTSGYKYGVVSRTYVDNDRIKIYTHTGEKDGDEITYKVEEEKDLAEPFKLDKFGNEVKDSKNKNVRRETKVKDGEVVKFKINKDGEIAEDEFYVMEKENIWVMKEKTDFGKTSLSSSFKKVDSNDNKSFAVDNRAVIVDAEGLEWKDGKAKFDTDNFGIAKWEDIAEDNYNEKLEYYVFTKKSNDIDVDALVFVGEEGANTASDEEAVYVIDKWSKGGDDYVKYASYETGKVEEREVDKGLDKGNPDERPYIAKVKSDGTIELYKNEDKGDFNYVSGVVKNKRNNVITLKGNDNEYKLSSSAIVYEEDVKKSTSNIREKDSVWFVVENDVDIRVIERLVGKEARDVAGSATGSTTVETDGVVTYINSNKIQLDSGRSMDVEGAATVLLGKIKTAFFDETTGLPNTNTEVEVELVKTGDVVTGIKNVVVSTKDTTDYSKALTEDYVVRVNVTDDLTSTDSISRLVNIDFGKYTVTGDLTVNTTEAGTMTLSGTNAAELDGNLNVTATNATFNQNVEVTGTVTVNAISTSTYNLNAKADKVVWNVAKDAKGKVAKLNLNAAVDKVKVNSGKEVAIKGADKITTTLTANGKVDLDKAIADEKIIGEENVTVNDTPVVEDTTEADAEEAVKAAEALVEGVKVADLELDEAKTLQDKLGTAIDEANDAVALVEETAKKVKLQGRMDIVEAVKEEVDDRVDTLEEADEAVSKAKAAVENFEEVMKGTGKNAEGKTLAEVKTAAEEAFEEVEEGTGKNAEGKTLAELQQVLEDAKAALKALTPEA